MTAKFLGRYDSKPIPHCLPNSFRFLLGNRRHVANRVAEVSDEPCFLNKSFVSYDLLKALLPSMLNDAKQLWKGHEGGFVSRAQSHPALYFLGLLEF